VVSFIDDVKQRAHRLEIPFGRHGVDPYGIVRDDVALLFQPLAFLYRHYFNVTVSGVHHIPARGRGMIVSNHSGGWALDGMMVIASTYLEMDPPRLAQGMAEKFINRIPFGSFFTGRTGNFVGTPANATHMLENERLLMVFPEGSRGTEKLFPERHSLVRFGTGFMRLALSTGTPIIPTGVAGTADAIPTVRNLYKLAKLVGVPYIPVTPWGVALPKPCPVHIAYGEPMLFEGDGTEEDKVIVGYVEQVKDRIADLITVARRARGEDV
jgi:1-acyl-sn-glycerol-3-phosphate acyltransferase